MGIEAWIVLAVVAFILVALIRNTVPPDILFLGATTFFAITKIIDPKVAFAGFANPGMITVAALFVVVAGLRDTGVLDLVGRYVLGSAKTEKGALLTLSSVVVPLSAVLNNTPIVAMFMPIVIDWCRRHNISPSRLLIPLSYLTILGGTCTLIGTSTNLVVSGLMEQNDLPKLGIFELGYVGVPYAIVGVIYLMFCGKLLLPERKELLEQLGDARREYLVEMQVQPKCRLIGQTVEKAGLRQLPGLFLIEIDRNGEIIGPVGPEEVIEQDDRLVFTGIVSSIVELEKIGGLLPVADSNYDVTPGHHGGRRLCEAVISHSSPLIGKTIREADFRAAYGAAVVAVHRAGKRITIKLGDVVLQPGDTLLLQTQPHFLRAHRHDPAFYLISDVDDWRPVRRERSWVAIGLFFLLLGLMTTDAVPIELAAVGVAVAMIATSCLSSGDAHRSIEWQVLITIAASYGVGEALEVTKAANVIAMTVVEATKAGGPIVALAVIYFLCSLVTEMITNNAAAVLMFPFCVEIAKIYNVSPTPFMVALMLSASASFMTPIGYQTNMMVYGPGGYKFTDFMRIGAPLHIVLWLIAILLIPIVWPF